MWNIQLYYHELRIKDLYLFNKIIEVFDEVEMVVEMEN